MANTLAGKTANGSSGKAGKVKPFGQTPFTRAGGSGGQKPPSARVGIGIKHPRATY